MLVVLDSQSDLSIMIHYYTSYSRLDMLLTSSRMDTTNILPPINCYQNSFKDSPLNFSDLLTEKVALKFSFNRHFADLLSRILD